MATIVQKFGGTSLADPQCISRCARRAVATQAAGHQVVVVVSAMGSSTDRLLELAYQVTDRPSQRELDALLATGEQVSSALMSMAIHKLGVDAVGLTGPRLGIETDPVHCKARIKRIDADRIRKLLGQDRIIVAAGFQGVSPDGEITTLGRGGSDTTAVALAAALDAPATGGVCEIYTDVDGVYTADPRIVPDARKLDRISYEEMLELASLGAGVMHSRAVIFGRKYNVPIHVRPSGVEPEQDLTNGNAGTMIVPETPEMEAVSVVGCALTPNLGRVTVRGLPNTPGVEGTLFQHIAARNILVDDIMQIEIDQRADVSFTVMPDDLTDIEQLVKQAIASLAPEASVHLELDLAKVSAVGVGMRSHSGVAATMFRALGEAGINIANITTSEIKISCIIPRDQGTRALQVVHSAFGLEHENAASQAQLVN